MTGGTALSQFYLQHRYSEDLDFFTNQQGIIRNAIREFESALINKRIRFRITRSFDAFAECLAEFQDEVVKIVMILPIACRRLFTNQSLEYSLITT